MVLFTLGGCIWLAALIVLVSDSHLRQEVNSEGAFELPLNSGPFLGIIVMDALNM
jgi:hypothetical protein